MRVIKLGGRVQSDPALPGVLTAAWITSPELIIVHGGGDAMSALQRAFGREAQFVDGKRVTAPDDLDLLRMALSGSANKRLVAALVGAGLPAVGISGEDGGLLRAAADQRDTLGEVGTPSVVNPLLLYHLIAGGFCPVISPLGRDQDSTGGGVLNVNGDDAAAAIAIAMRASELLLVSDVDGVLINGAAAAHLDGDAVRHAIQSGTAHGGMAAKLRAALDAIGRGVARVRIGGVNALADDARGTVITLAGVSV